MQEFCIARDKLVGKNAIQNIDQVLNFKASWEKAQIVFTRWSAITFGKGVLSDDDIWKFRWLMNSEETRKAGLAAAPWLQQVGYETEWNNNRLIAIVKSAPVSPGGPKIADDRPAEASEQKGK
jgi:hypothetical protein